MTHEDIEIEDSLLCQKIERDGYKRKARPLEVSGGP
jgi:hypothetical protein